MNMCTALDKLEEQRREEGRIEGRIEGREEIVAAFLKAGMDLEKIKAASGMDDEQLEEIRRKWDRN